MRTGLVCQVTSIDKSPKTPKRVSQLAFLGGRATSSSIARSRSELGRSLIDLSARRLIRRSFAKRRSKRLHVIVHASLKVVHGDLPLYTHAFSDSYDIVVGAYRDLLPLLDQQVG